MWLLRRVSEIGRLARAPSRYRIGWWTALRGLLRLVFSQEYSANEVLMLGLLDPSSLVREPMFVSKENLLSIQSRINPRSCFPYTEDKLVFFQRCVDKVLATPRVFAAFCPGRVLPNAVPVITGSSELLALMAGGAPRDFVFKPAPGVHGRGVLLLRFEGSTFSTPDGSLYDADALLAHAKRSVYADWLFQERLSPHRDLVELSGTQYLQTARVVSYLDPTGDVRIPFAWLRIVAGNTVFDNFNFGASGNLVGTIDVATGRLKHVLSAASDGLGLIELACHPRTGRPFAGFSVPYMPEIRDLVTRAAHAFAPLRTVGWDVAITDDGPSLVEGNVTWDPLPTRDDLLSVARSLK